MKRIKAACIQQTVHFQLKEDLEHELAVRLVQEEYARYQQQLKRTGIRYKIDEETTLPDGSIQIKIKKQYNATPVGAYLD